MSNGFKPASALGLNSVQYLESMLEQYRMDPQSVDAGWRFALQLADELAPRANVAGELDAAIHIRRWGHVHADLNPLAPASADPVVSLTASRLAQASRLSPDAMVNVYARYLAVETGHIDDPEIAAWVHSSMEQAAPAPTHREKKDFLQLLASAEEFEKFLYLRFPGKKKFGAEGSESMMVALQAILENAAADGVEEVVLGTMHRGRMNLLANVLGKDLPTLFAEFKGMHPFFEPAGSCADVPYHLGLETRLPIGGAILAVTLLSNPSHLEAVDPVVLGLVRARQDARPALDRQKVLGIIFHTDAAVIGQGVVTEVLQLSGVEGFTTGGTVHVVVNNQLGFTTEPIEARTSKYCTGAWKAIDSPIFHVNGDMPEAVARAAAMATAFRQTFGRDAVIDLQVYRRNGHNEMDEPRFTQPLLYREIDKRLTTAARYGAYLQSQGVTSEQDLAAMRASARARLEAGYRASSTLVVTSDGYPGGVWAGRHSSSVSPGKLDTGVPREKLLQHLDAIATLPDGFTVGAKLKGLVEGRRDLGKGIPWATAEALAFASLVTQGTPVRITGQDSVRGAFSHRHYSLTDTQNGSRNMTLSTLDPSQAPFTAINSPLSEYATLGFEYGYSLHSPDSLVIWEAQFGDFANGAQIIIDQFIVSGEAKWRQPSGLVMLLPHGLEGQGPEHSSCRIERYLQLAANGNFTLANPSTPANYFHLLRRQILDRGRRPLVVISPKTLLRLPAATSRLRDIEPETSFETVIVRHAPHQPRKIILCSGKLAYELEAAALARQDDAVMVVRLEQLYPMPRVELSRILGSAAASGARLVWAQEEPENMGAWPWYDRKLEDLAASLGHPQPRFAYVGRPEAASPAGSFHSDHSADQESIVQRALD